MLSKRGGSLAIKVVIEKPVDLAARLIRRACSAPRTSRRRSSSPTVALAQMSPLIPDAFVNLPFPGTRGPASKFELLNGWRLPEMAAVHRRAFRRGRWFLKRTKATHLNFEVKHAVGSTGETYEVTASLNGMQVAAHPVGPTAWTPFEVDLTSCRPGETFALEVRSFAAASDLEGASFDVRRRRFGPGGDDWILRMTDPIKDRVAAGLRLGRTALRKVLLAKSSLK